MNNERLMTLLQRPLVSEKSARLGDLHRQYVFRVHNDATKPQIARAVELMFSVEVGAVQVLNQKGKQKRTRGRAGQRGDWKKAYVTLKQGHEIHFVGQA